jgi:hypothetical protein
MPTFAAVFDHAEDIACNEQAYEIAELIAADEPRRTEIVRKMQPRDLRRYDLVMDRAYSTLALKENTRGRIQLND